MKNKKALDIISLAIVLLFVYAATSKLIDFASFKQQMLLQHFSHRLSILLIWLLPASELFTSALLLFAETNRIGLYLAALMLLLFTGYAGLILLGYFRQVPCSCGGILKAMGWKVHFVFNLICLLISLYGLYITNGERRMGRQTK